MNAYSNLPRRFFRFSLDASLLAFLAVVLACANNPPGAVEENWGKSYDSVMQAQIENPNPEYTSGPVSTGTDSVTGEIILENYQEDLRRTQTEERETFIIESGVN